MLLHLQSRHVRKLSNKFVFLVSFLFLLTVFQKCTKCLHIATNFFSKSGTCSFTELPAGTECCVLARWWELSLHKAQRFNFFFFPFHLRLVCSACLKSLRTQAHFNIKSREKKNWYESTKWFKPCSSCYAAQRVEENEDSTCILDFECRRTLFLQESVEATSDYVDLAHSGFRSKLMLLHPEGDLKQI